MMDALALAHRLLFPSPRPAHYEYDTFKHICWIPVQQPYLTQTADNNATTTTPAVHIPLAITGTDAASSSVASSLPLVSASLPPSIPCLYFPRSCSDLCIIYAHPNAADLGSMEQIINYYSYHLRAHIIVPEYPGYGICAGEANEQSINATIDTVLCFVRDTLGFPLSRILLWGQSIGTGPVCWITASLNQYKRSLGGIILQSPYLSIKSVVKALVGSMASSFVTERWDNLACMRAITDPVLFIHGLKDTIIPYTHTEELYAECASERKHMLLINTATHNEFDYQLDIIQPIQQFIQLHIYHTNIKPHQLPIVMQQQQINGMTKHTPLIIPDMYLTVPSAVLIAAAERAAQAKEAELAKQRVLERKEYLTALFNKGKQQLLALTSRGLGQVMDSTTGIQTTDNTPTPTQQQDKQQQPEEDLPSSTSDRHREVDDQHPMVDVSSCSSSSSASVSAASTPNCSSPSQSVEHSPCAHYVVSPALQLSHILSEEKETKDEQQLKQQQRLEQARLDATSNNQSNSLDHTHSSL